MLPEEMVEASIRESAFVPIPVRQCRECREIKPLTREYWWSDGHGGLRWRCTICSRALRQQQVATRTVAQDESVRVARRAAAKRYRTAVRSDPARLERHRESRRMAEALRRRRAGMRAVPQRSSLGVVVDREPAARVAVDVLQAALVDSGLTLVEVARQLGWTRRRAGATNGETDVDLTRVARRLGLKPWTSRGKTYVQKTVPYEAAVELIRAMDVDPVDYGI